jgi:hypothetical protein
LEVPVEFLKESFKKAHESYPTPRRENSFNPNQKTLPQGRNEISNKIANSDFEATTQDVNEAVPLISRGWNVLPQLTP